MKDWQTVSRIEAIRVLLTMVATLGRDVRRGSRPCSRQVCIAVSMATRGRPWSAILSSCSRGKQHDDCNNAYCFIYVLFVFF